MEKTLFCSLDLVERAFTEYDSSQISTYRDEFLDLADKLCEDGGNTVVFVSRDQNRLNDNKQKLERKGYHRFKYSIREAVKNAARENVSNNIYSVFISGNDVDFFVAVHTKALFICPRWILYEEKSGYYGVMVDTPKQLFTFVKTLNNHNVWYSQVDIDDKTTCISMMDARTKYGMRSVEEKTMMQGFQDFLKQGINRNYYTILKYHFLANMTRTTLFDDIELFGVIPSSNGKVNPDLFDFATQIRFIKNKKLPKRLYQESSIENQNLFLRHTQRKALHNLETDIRSTVGGKYEFDTLMINPEYKKKIDKLRKDNRFNVLVFDDYMDYGNGFNAVRCLLEALGAQKIVLVSLGSFRREFAYKDYQFSGDLYRPGYGYKMVSEKIIDNFTIDPRAKTEVHNLHSIFNE